VRSLHDSLHFGELMTGGQQGVRPLRTDLLVLVECRGNSLRAVGICALTDCQFNNGEGVKSVAARVA
jgi:hypothetical protein